jgi:hypothetical protein
MDLGFFSIFLEGACENSQRVLLGEIWMVFFPSLSAISPRQRGF